MAFGYHGDLLRVNNYACATAIRSGAIVTLTSTGAVVEATNNSTAILGVALGYADGSTVLTVAVADHPDQEYKAENDNAAAFTQAQIGDNCSVVAGTPFMTTQSGHKIDHSSIDTTSTRAFRIVGIYDNKDTGAFGAAVVRPNNHQEKAGVTGV